MICVFKKGYSCNIRAQLGFTIVEILVVTVIIGVLAAIVIVSYMNISNKANIASLTSDLNNASRQLKLFQVDQGIYPDTINCSIADSTTNKCLKSSDSSAYNYQVNNAANPQEFSLNLTRGDLTYSVTNNSTPVAIAPFVCPDGFIPVPGSSTYGTSDFCVMKYEAKRVGTSTTPISTAAGIPWAGVTQLAAIANSPNVEGCTGCHLITEAEWMTLAQNVLNVSSNWSTGVVGSGYIYSGHNDNNPGSALAASPDDDIGYFETGQTTGNQRRTLTLSNGEVIWDIAGNAWDWTSGTVISPARQPGIDGAGATFREWTTITNANTLTIDPSPISTGILGADLWTSANGIGKVYGDSDVTVLRGTIRGAHWGYGISAGVLSVDYYYAPSASNTATGFRVTAPFGS